MNETAEQTSPLDFIAYIDEAEEKGLSRNLAEGRDERIGLMCALVVPAENLDSIRERFRPAFDRFAAAAPEGARIYITDAFKPGNENWASVARDVREECLSLYNELELVVVYEARRLGVHRDSFNLS